MHFMSECSDTAGNDLSSPISFVVMETRERELSRTGSVTSDGDVIQGHGDEKKGRVMIMIINQSSLVFIEITQIGKEQELF